MEMQNNAKILEGGDGERLGAASTQRGAPPPPQTGLAISRQHLVTWGGSGGDFIVNWFLNLLPIFREWWLTSQRVTYSLNLKCWKWRARRMVTYKIQSLLKMTCFVLLFYTRILNRCARTWNFIWAHLEIPCLSKWYINFVIYFQGHLSYNN